MSTGARAPVALPFASPRRSGPAASSGGPSPAPALTLRRDLRAITVDGASFSLMVGVGETYLAAFALALGMGEVVSGLVGTVPLVAGALLQLISPWAVRRFRSHRRWVVLCATIQAASFVPLVVAAALGRLAAPLLFLVAAVYWAAGLGTGPAWNTWVGSLVPTRLRARYFAYRTRVTQAAVLLGFLIGGAGLQLASGRGQPLTAFFLMFLVAGACRAVSAWHLAQQSEPQPPHDGHRIVAPWELLRRCRSNGDGRLLVYLLSVHAAVQIAGPYFTPYMLRKLMFPYWEYVLLVAVAFVAKAMALPTLGRLAQRCGAQRLLWLGGVGIVPLAAGWLVSDDLVFLACLQAAGGVAWAAYELGMFLLFFDAIAEEERTSVLTTFNLAQALAQVLGSLVGAALLSLLGRRIEAYLALFALSSTARLLTLPLLARVPRLSVDSASLSTRTVAVRPDGGMIDRPVLASIDATPAVEPTLLDELSGAAPGLFEDRPFGGDVPSSTAQPEAA